MHPSIRRQVATREGIRPGEETTVRCHYCGTSGVATWPLNLRGRPSYWPMLPRGFALDHVIPRAKGGPDEASNLVIACGRCNSSKRDRPAPLIPGRSAE